MVVGVISVFFGVTSGPNATTSNVRTAPSSRVPAPVKSFVITGMVLTFSDFKSQGIWRGGCASGGGCGQPPLDVIGCWGCFFFGVTLWRRFDIPSLFGFGVD